jgi:RraA family protein
MDLISQFKTIQTAIISDNLSRLPGTTGIRPFHKGGAMCGTALTVKTATGDNLMIHEALEHLKPGNVLVIDAGGDISRAVIGEIMMTIAKYKGAVGIVIDGAIRDAAVLAQSDFPVFAKAANHRGPYKNGPGQINIPVNIAGLVISPGDIVVGDEDGIVAFSPTVAKELLVACRKQEAREEETLKSIREGRYQGSYGKK